MGDPLRPREGKNPRAEASSWLCIVKTRLEATEVRAEGYVGRGIVVICHDIRTIPIYIYYIIILLYYNILYFLHTHTHTHAYHFVFYVSYAYLRVCLYIYAHTHTHTGARVVMCCTSESRTSHLPSREFVLFDSEDVYVEYAADSSELSANQFSDGVG